VKELSVSAAVAFKGSDSLAIVPAPPLALNVIVELFGGCGVTTLEGLENGLRPYLFTAATTNR
jgi:hypothetical protein